MQVSVRFISSSLEVPPDPLWERRFGADPSVVGRPIVLDGEPMVVVGVLPQGFGFDLPVVSDFAGPQDVWGPQRFGPALRGSSGRWLQVLARLGPGVTFEQANGLTKLTSSLVHLFTNTITNEKGAKPFLTG